MKSQEVTKGHWSGLLVGKRQRFIQETLMKETIGFQWPCLTSSPTFITSDTRNIHIEYHTIKGNLQVKLGISCESESALVLIN